MVDIEEQSLKQNPHPGIRVKGHFATVMKDKVTSFNFTRAHVGKEQVNIMTYESKKKRSRAQKKERQKKGHGINAEVVSMDRATYVWPSHISCIVLGPV